MRHTRPQRRSPRIRSTALAYALPGAHAGEDPLTRIGLDAEGQAKTVPQTQGRMLLEDIEPSLSVEGLQAAADGELAVGPVETELEVQLQAPGQQRRPDALAAGAWINGHRADLHH